MASIASPCTPVIVEGDLDPQIQFVENSLLFHKVYAFICNIFLSSVLCKMIIQTQTRRQYSFEKMFNTLSIMERLFLQVPVQYIRVFFFCFNCVLITSICNIYDRMTAQNGWLNTNNCCCICYPNCLMHNKMLCIRIFSGAVKHFKFKFIDTSSKTWVLIIRSEMTIWL